MALNGINDFGDMVGGYSVMTHTESTARSVRFVNGRYEDVYPNYSFATGINNHGHIVGSIMEEGLPRSFLSINGVVENIDLNQPNSGVVVHDINDDGSIVGFFLDADNSLVRYGFIGTPANSLTPTEILTTTTRDV